MRARLTILVLVLSALPEGHDCKPQQIASDPNYVLGEQSTGRVGKVEINTNAAQASIPTRQQQRSFQVATQAPVQTFVQTQPQQATNYQRQLSQYEVELLQYRRALEQYQQVANSQLPAQQPQSQYQQYQQYAQPAYQPQAYQPQAYQPQAYQPQAYQSQAYEPQAYQTPVYQSQAPRYDYSQYQTTRRSSNPLTDLFSGVSRSFNFLGLG